jgi:DNA-binding NtrC family response regulator/tetratricopeptide (TPR) repeat protein
MLYFLNELASLRAFTGEYAEAARLCEEGFRLAGRRRGFSVRELVINLHATRGNVALRTFDSAGACRSLETALEIAEAIGSPESQAVILNNLGIALASLDRYRDAIQAYRSAEKLCLRLDEGPSLVSIHGNLAILHAKTGDWLAMEEALAAGERMGAAAIGIKQELFLSHARGLCLLYRGRFREARLSLEAAIRLGEKVGDPFVAAFDSVYRAEAALHEGAYGEARRRLEDLSAGRSTATVRRMALSRLAYLHAISGRGAGVKACASSFAAAAADRAVPFLDAWDGLYLGWALSLSRPGDVGDDAPAAGPLLERSAAYFREHGVVPGAALAEWALAERAFLEGDIDGARRILAGIPAAANDFTAVLVPLLAARLAVEAAGPRDLEACADLLAEAGEKVVGNALPEWELRILALRSTLAAPAGPRGKEVEERRRKLAEELSPDDRRRYLESPRWKRWVEVSIPRATAQPPGVPVEAGAGADSAARTAAITREGGEASRRGVIARSPAMRDLVAFCERIRDSELPVLIEGETGTGKEMIARIIHRESRRSAGPLVAVDCAAIPEPLVDAELFGARAGAFTDSRADRPGLISAAAGGTLLVDEVARIPAGVQGKLLRALSEGRFRMLGDEAESAADVRFLFTSTLDVEEEAAAGRLRRDLFHRIQVLRVKVPPLRERREDIRLLVERILAAGNVPPPVLGKGVLERLLTLPWPGNVRELENVLARLSLEGSRRISLEALEAHVAGRGTADLFPRGLLEREDLPALKESLEREYVLHHLERLRGDTTALSRFLGISRLQLYRRCHRLGIRLRRRRQEPPLL